MRRRAASSRERALVDAGELDGDVQPGGDARDRGVRELVGERLRRARRGGRGSGARMRRRWRSSSPRSRKSRERLLVDPRACRRSARQLLGADRLEQRRRDDEPAEPERRRERLAGRAGVDDAVGLEALERADGRAVVAVLGVVVVLDRERVAVAQPGEQRGAALAGEHGAGRVLVGGGDDDGVGVRAELVDAQAVVVDRDRDGLEPGAARDPRCSGLRGPRARCGARRRRRARGRAA